MSVHWTCGGRVRWRGGGSGGGGTEKGFGQELEGMEGVDDSILHTER